MPAPLSVAPFFEGVLVLVAAATGAAVLLMDPGRRRALTMAGALAVSALAVTLVAGDSVREDISGHVALAVAAGGAGLAVVGALSLVIVRHPGALVLLAAGALPFRIPIPTGPDETANLLLPLYAVIAAGVVAALAGALRAEGEVEPRAARRIRRLDVALALVLVLYALQALYSTDLERAVKNVCFFYVPFAVLFRLLAEVTWTRRLVATAFGIVLAISLLAAGVGFFEYATKHLLLPNDKVLAANELKPYFRVNSLFFDPNIYGRFLALTMVGAAVVMLWRTRGRDIALLAAALAVLWAGLVLSLSQSSFAALAGGLIVVAALRFRARVVAGVALVAIAVAGALAAFAPDVIGVRTGTENALNKTTSGRAKLLRAGIDMAQERPVLGFGSGAFAERYRRRERVYSPSRAAESHTIPVTVAAEQGAAGLAAYAWLLLCAALLLFGGLGSALRSGPPDWRRVARAGIAAAFWAFWVHTLVYAAFLEDPLAWTLLAAAVALCRTPVNDPSAA